GNGELCFPRDEVPNNYTGYGDREYSWQANLFVSHLKPDVYQVETKVVIIGGHYLCEENRNAVDWFGNGELCFPRDDVPNNYTGYGGREYSWQANHSVSHPKPDVYRVETKGILSNTHLLASQLFLRNTLVCGLKYNSTTDSLLPEYVMFLVTAMVVTGGQYSTDVLKLNIALTEIWPYIFDNFQGILDVSLRLHDNRSVVDWLGNHKLCFPPDDVPNNYTGYGGREYSWKANPSVSHPKPDVYRVDTKAMVVTGGHYSNEALKLNIALIEIGLIFLIIFKEYQMSPFACMIIAVLLNGW
ncbi:hypothetical protein Tco_1130533, partial [Tanacetum coccineum]